MTGNDGEKAGIRKAWTFSHLTGAREEKRTENVCKVNVNSDLGRANMVGDSKVYSIVDKNLIKLEKKPKKLLVLHTTTKWDSRFFWKSMTFKLYSGEFTSF